MTSITSSEGSFQSTQTNEKSDVSYDGSVASIYKIWIKNLILSVITLFIYRAWAKTRMRKYLWSHIKVNGHALTYTGTGKELFRGFIKVALFYFVMSSIIFAITFGVMLKVGLEDIQINQAVTQQNIEEALGLCGYKDISNIPDGQYKSCLFKYGLASSYNASMVKLFSTALTWSVILYIIFYAQYSALRYRLSRTTWCGIHGSLTGSPRKYAFMCIGRFIINIVTLGIAIPKSDLIKQGAITNNMYLGNKKASFHEGRGKLGSVNIKTLLLAIPTLGFSRLWYLAELRNQKLANLSFVGVHFKGTFTGYKYLKLSIGNLLILIATVGFGMPIILNRTINFSIKNIHVLGNVNELTISQGDEKTKAGNMGEGFEDSLDTDIGFDVDFGLI